MIIVHGKLHKYLRQTTLLPLRLRKTEFTLHRQAFYFDHTKLPGIKFTADGTY